MKIKAKKFEKSVEDTQIHRMTVGQIVAHLIHEIDNMRYDAGVSEAGRDYSLAITHLEDALTRYNSARYRVKGTWKRADPDLPKEA